MHPFLIWGPTYDWLSMQFLNSVNPDIKPIRFLEWAATVFFISHRCIIHQTKNCLRKGQNSPLFQIGSLQIRILTIFTYYIIVFKSTYFISLSRYLVLSLSSLCFSLWILCSSFSNHRESRSAPEVPAAAALPPAAPPQPDDDPPPPLRSEDRGWKQQCIVPMLHSWIDGE